MVKGGSGIASAIEGGFARGDEFHSFATDCAGGTDSGVGEERETEAAEVGAGSAHGGGRGGAGVEAGGGALRVVWGVGFVDEGFVGVGGVGFVDGFGDAGGEDVGARAR